MVILKIHNCTVTSDMLLLLLVWVLAGLTSYVTDSIKRTAIEAMGPVLQMRYYSMKAKYVVQSVFSFVLVSD